MNHPAGRIGKRLVMKVKDVMKEGKQVCKCTPEENGLAALSTMAANPNSGGCCMVVDAEGVLLGADRSPPPPLAMSPTCCQALTVPCRRGRAATGPTALPGLLLKVWPPAP